MTDAEAIDVLVQHFLLDNERSLQEVTDALVQVSQSDSLESFGRPCSKAFETLIGPIYKRPKLPLLPNNRKGNRNEQRNGEVWRLNEHYFLHRGNLACQP